MEIDHQNYAIVWDELPARGIRAASRRLLPQLAPYFVSGAACRQASREIELVLDKDMLVRGVLHEWLVPRHPRIGTDPTAWRLALRYLLEDLRVDSGFESLELMTLVHAMRVREGNGQLPAMKMLMTAHQLLRRSTEIRSDLILDLWSLVERVEEIDRGSAFAMIRDLYDGIRFEALQEDVTDQLDYANFVALSYLGDYQRRNWLFWRVIAKRVRHKQLKHRMIHLLNKKAPNIGDGPRFPAHNVHPDRVSRS